MESITIKRKDILERVESDCKLAITAVVVFCIREMLNLRPLLKAIAETECRIMGGAENDFG